MSRRCAISRALEADPLQRAPGQPAVSQKRDQNNLRVFVINIAAGGGKPSERAADAEPEPHHHQQRLYFPVKKSAVMVVSVETIPILHGALHLSTFPRVILR